VPATTITIDRRQRDGLYELVRNHIAGLGDVWVAMEHKSDFATAERLGLEFAEDIRLLQGIGWHPNDGRDTFELTVPIHDLMEALKRLHDEAERVLTESPSERRSREEDEEVNRRFQLGMNTCEEMLVDLANGEGERA
jgi:hypothetical protein